MAMTDFPPRRLDSGDTDWRSRRRDDGYDYATAATAGAALAREALEALRPTPKKRPLKPRVTQTVQTPAPAPKVAPRPRTAAPVGMPAYFDPSEDIPIGEAPPEDEWRDR